jgi:hypothetical protein
LFLRNQPHTKPTTLYRGASRVVARRGNDEPVPRGNFKRHARGVTKNRDRIFALSVRGAWELE